MSNESGVSGSVVETWECGDEDRPKAVVATLRGTTLVISGTGFMRDYDEDIPWESCGNHVIKVTEAVVKDGVTNIGEQAFRECKDLASITIAASVGAVGDRAFYKCAGLKSVTVANPVPPKADKRAFDGVDKSAVSLYVPTGAYEAYKSAAEWKDFKIAAVG
ncbi:hypothetical protein R80B4_03139 [Fibrobacteres bacterium R8-0-B4]